MEQYSGVITYKLAKLLDNHLFSELSDYKYSAQNNLIVTWDNYLGTKTFNEGELIEDGDYIHGKYYYAPLYCEVLDWLENNYNIVIELSPVYTFSTINKLAYFYKVYLKDDETSSLKLLFEDNKWFSSFTFLFETVIKELIDKEYIKL